MLLAVEDVYQRLINAPDVIADLPLQRERKIGVRKIVHHDGKRIVVETENLVWATFFRQDFDNAWSDEQVLDKLKPHFVGHEFISAAVVRGLRKERWECCVQMQFGSSAIAKSIASALRQGGFHAGSCIPTSIVDRNVHHLGK